MSASNEKNYLWVLLLVVILIAVVAVVCWYFFFTKDVMYIYPATGQTENEILGQAGDYVGGILNPLIGLITVYLLYRTYVTQKKELKETAKTMEIQSSIASEQLKLTRDEYSRKQLVEIIESEYLKYESIFNVEFNISIDVPTRSDLLIFLFESGNSYTLNEIISTVQRMDAREDCEQDTYSDVLNQRFIEYDPTLPETYFRPVWSQLKEVKSCAERIQDINLDLINVLHLKNIEKIWYVKYFNALVKAKDVGALSAVEFDAMLQKMRDSRNEKFKSDE